MAFIRIMNEAGHESVSVTSREIAVENLLYLDEEWVHPHVPNAVTGLNYDTDPEGFTRVGLEYCIWMYAPGAADDGSDSCSLPPPSATWEDGDPGPWDLNPIVFPVHYPNDDCNSEWNEWELVKNLIEARFGKKQWVKDGATVTNPHPHKIIISVDDSGSMEYTEAWPTIYKLIEYYRSYMTTAEMRGMTDFRVNSQCTNTQDADGYTIPVGFWYNFETGILNSGPDCSITSIAAPDGSGYQFYFYKSGVFGEGFFNVFYPFLRNYYYGI